MITNSDSLKAKLKTKSKNTNIPSDALLKMFMFERILARISNSKYKENFILKGGFLISSIFGINLRSTIDIDTTIKGLPINKKTLEKIIKEIIEIQIGDNCTFEISDIKDIRAEDIYNGYEVILKVSIDKIWAFINIDMTTGDPITYKEIEFNYKTLLDEETINIFSYNYETIIAEKYEAIISRNIDNSRMKDYYDLYMFMNLKFHDLNTKTLVAAINNTAKKRNTMAFISDSNNIIKLINGSEKIRSLWGQYQAKFGYAKDIEFDEVIGAVKIVNEIIEQTKDY